MWQKLNQSFGTFQNKSKHLCFSVCWFVLYKIAFGKFARNARIFTSYVYEMQHFHILSKIRDFSIGWKSFDVPENSFCTFQLLYIQISTAFCKDINSCVTSNGEWGWSRKRLKPTTTVAGAQLLRISDSNFRQLKCSWISLPKPCPILW